MTQEEFDAKYPLISSWIQRVIAEHRSQARTVASLGFKRLPLFFPVDVLEAAKVVYVSTVPAPPLNALGLSQFADFENMQPAGITYLDTFFSLEEMRANESHHFHELVHIIQWRMLGPKGFITAYANGLERMGYRHSPLEVMAYTLESAFRNSKTGFDVETVVNQQLRALYGIHEPEA